MTQGKVMSRTAQESTKKQMEQRLKERHI